MADTDLLALQVTPTEIQPSVTKTETDLLLQPTSVYERLRHFPENVYDLSPESSVSKLMKVLLGDAGAGQLRKRLFVQHMQATLQGSHFFDLDRFYGPLLGIRRSPSEVLTFDPYVQTATRDQWDDAHARDASFRSRIEQLARAIVYGPTPAGMELIAEALLAVDCDVYESYVQADGSYQSYDELQDQFGVNLLSDNAASIETDDSEWAVSGSHTGERSSDWSFHDGFTSSPLGGEYSLLVTSDGGGAIEIEYDGDPRDVLPNESYTFNVVAYTEDEQDAHVEVDWYDDGPTLISTSVGDTEALLEGIAVPLTLTDDAPAGADTAVMRIVLEDSTNDEGYYFDRMEFAFTAQTYANMEDTPYSLLEGAALNRLSGDERRIFTVRPKRDITPAEAYDLRRVLSKFKPADSRVVISTSGSTVYSPRPLDAAWADSVHWEIVSKVSSATLPISPYQVPSFGEPTEQPRPPFAGYQGEAWSYITNLAGVSAFSRIDSQNTSIPTQRVTYRNGTHMDFGPEQAILPIRMVQAGRLVSDGVLVAYPYGRRHAGDVESVTPLYSDGIEIEQFQAVLDAIPNPDPFQGNPQHRYWVSEPRDGDDITEEIIEVRLSQPSLINYITFEVSKYPIRVSVELRDTEGAQWVEVMRWVNESSTPAYLPMGREAMLDGGHPHHVDSNHWQRLSSSVEAMSTTRARIRIRRIGGERVPRVSVSDPTPVPYSIALRSFDLGYRVRSRDDFADLDSPIIAATRDLFGSQVQYEVAEQTASRAIDANAVTAWRCEPQPVNYAVVNLYLDTRGDDGSGTIIDRFYMDPTHAGVHLSIYASMDPDDPPDPNPERLTADEFMGRREWTPIPRDFVTQKGYLHLPPTKGRYWKFEFTGLTAEPYENFVPINRRVKLFPRSLVESQGYGYAHAVEARLPGMSSAIESATISVRYRDAVAALNESSEYNGGFRPTEALYVTDLNGQSRVQNASWAFGFTPWHQQDRAPRFPVRSVHRYDEVEVRHSTKVGFFVGLRELRAYRSNFEADDDSTVYFDTFDDARNLNPGFDWAFNPGYLTSKGTSPPVVASSRTFLSLNHVKAVQFATEQSAPVQLVPDSEFRNPFLATYDWNDNDSFTRVGDAQLIYRSTDYSVLNVRYVVPPPKPLDRVGGLVQTIHQPVFSWRPFEVADDEAAAATEGGMRSPVLGLSGGGRVYAAVRFTQITDQTSPLYLQIIDNNDDSVLAEKALPALRGQLVEDYVPLDITAPNMQVRIRLVQFGKSNDAWSVSSLSLFDESLVWEFSNNGGGDWYEAKEIRNNDNGILTFPIPGNQLRYRVTAYRENLWVSAIKIRPHYLGVGNARETGTHRGPNISYYDQDIPIHEDPMFTSWKLPVPYYWYSLGRRFPILAVEGAPIFSEFSRFFARPIVVNVDEPVVDVDGVILRARSIHVNLSLTGPISQVDRELELDREVQVDVSGVTSSASALLILGVEGGILHPIVDPVFSENTDD